MANLGRKPPEVDAQKLRAILGRGGLQSTEVQGMAHVVTGPMHTAAGRTANQVLQAAGPSTLKWSTGTIDLSTYVLTAAKTGTLPVGTGAAKLLAKWSDANTLQSALANGTGVLTNSGTGILTWAAAATGTVDGDGDAGRIAEWADEDTLQSSTLIKTGTNTLTLATGAAAATAWIIPINATGVLTNTGTGVLSWGAASAVSNLVSLIFGDGSDSVVTISEDTELTRPMYYQTLTVNSGKKLITNGYSVFCRGTLTNNGGIYEVDPTLIGGGAGGNGTAIAGGDGGSKTDPAPGIFCVSVPNGSAGGFNAVGQDGSEADDKDSFYVDCDDGREGADGGAGDSAGGTGAAGKSASVATGRYCGINYRSICNAISIAGAMSPGANVLFVAYNGNGGSAGGGGGSGCGGGGGGAGGWCAANLCVFANVITGTGVFYCNGGAGGDGGAGYGSGAGSAGGGGGGAGGNGGIILLGYGSKAGTWTTNVTGGAHGNGGAGGNGGDAGADGPDGQDGVVIELT